MLQKSDPRNQSIKVWVGHGLTDREDAKVSVFDSVVQGGDAVWEGIRVYEEGVFLLDRHLDRLYDSAHAMAFEGIPDRTFVKKAIHDTLVANGMDKDTHIRLTLTRGEKITSGMDPRLNQSGCCLIVLAEWKPPVYDNDHGITVISSSIRRNSPRHLDSKIHHNNLINNILAKIQANVARKDAGLMLDADGFLAELNGTNIFLVKNGEVLTPFATACLHGITRGLVLEMCEDLGIPCKEANLSLTEIYTADEVFCTGTMGELTPVVEVDGRSTHSPHYNVLNKLNAKFEGVRDKYCVKVASLIKPD